MAGRGGRAERPEDGAGRGREEDGAAGRGEAAGGGAGGREGRGRRAGRGLRRAESNRGRPGRAPGQETAGWAGVQQGDAGPADQQVLRRLEDASLAGPGSLHRANPADAGRADQPPGPERRDLAGQLPAGIQEDSPHSLSRPIFP